MYAIITEQKIFIKTLGGVKLTSHTRSNNKKTFLETYIYDISAKLKEIDLFIKTSEENFSKYEVSEILYISEEEVENIMDCEKISVIDKRNFFRIMEKGSSAICKLFQRETECGSPYIYTRENISYIYNLDLSVVNEVCDNLNIKEVTSFTMPIVFSHIIN